jgi:hypothetical protein
MSAPPFGRHRANAVATSVMLIITGALRKWHATGDLTTLAEVRSEIESMLCDEFFEASREAANERRLLDDD